MKKKLLIGLSVLAALGAIAGGSYAYFTDVDDAENVFTVGNVDIDLLSETDEETIRLMPNNVDKTEVNYQIENTGNERAYVWLKVSIPKALAAESAADNVIHWNVPGKYWNGYQNNSKYWDEDQTEAVAEEDTWKVQETIEEGDNEVTYLLYTGAINPNEKTNIGISTIYLDNRVDKIDGQYVMVKNGFIEKIGYDLADTTIKVEAYGIQENGFDTVEDAFAAFQKQYPDGRPTSFEE